MSRNISVRYELQRSDFSLDVDVEIPMRGITGVFGESGAGKTALLRCIAGLERGASGRLVIGENISQTLQFAASGNAELGFIARSQLQAPSLPQATCSWPVPATMHPEIDQQAILLLRGADSEGAKSFLTFLRGDAAHAIILRHGYRLPEVKE